MDVGARTHWWQSGPLAHTSYLPASGIQSGQGQGDGEGGAHTGGDQSNLGVKPAFWALCKHCQLVDSRTYTVSS